MRDMHHAASMHAQRVFRCVLVILGTGYGLATYDLIAAVLRTREGEWTCGYVMYAFYLAELLTLSVVSSFVFVQGADAGELTSR